MCCAVARADGEVTSAEYERLLDLLSRVGQNAVKYSELERWIEVGPPELDDKLPDAAVRAFVQEAVAIAHADGKLQDTEIKTIKQLVERYFNLSSLES